MESQPIYGILKLKQISYWSGPKWVANTENWHQLSYFGEAYTVKGYGGAQITYYRNNNYVGGAYAYVDTWRTEKTDYQTVTIWDSLNPVAPKTIYYYGFQKTLIQLEHSMTLNSIFVIECFY